MFSDLIQSNYKPFPKSARMWKQLKDGGFTTSGMIAGLGYEPPPRAFFSKKPQKECFWCYVHGKCSDHIMIDGDEIPAKQREKWSIGDIRLNVVRCRKCGDSPRSFWRHDYKQCECGAVAVDGGSDYSRIIGNPEDYEKMIVMYQDYEPPEIKPKLPKVVDARLELLSLMMGLNQGQIENLKGIAEQMIKTTPRIT